MKEQEKETSEKIQKIFQEKNLFESIKQHLSDTGFPDLEIQHVVLKHVDNDNGNCPPGHKRVLVCSEGICEYQCIPIQ